MSNKAPAVAFVAALYGDELLEPIIADGPTELPNGSFGYTFDMSLFGINGLAHFHVVPSVDGE